MTRHLNCLAVMGLMGLLGAGVLGAAEPMAPPLTPQQRARLQERDGYQEESVRLGLAGKLKEAIDSAEKMVAIEREVFGDVHEEVASSLKFLAEMRAYLGEFD